MAEPEKEPEHPAVLQKEGTSVLEVTTIIFFCPQITGSCIRTVPRGFLIPPAPFPSIFQVLCTHPQCLQLPRDTSRSSVVYPR